MNRGTSTFASTFTSPFAGTGGTAVGQNYELDWHTVDGGAVSGTVGNKYELSGTIGLCDAGTLAGGAEADFKRRRSADDQFRLPWSDVCRHPRPRRSRRLSIIDGGSVTFSTGGEFESIVQARYRRTSTEMQG